MESSFCCLPACAAAVESTRPVKLLVRPGAGFAFSFIFCHRSNEGEGKGGEVGSLVRATCLMQLSKRVVSQKEAGKRRRVDRIGEGSPARKVTGKGANKNFVRVRAKREDFKPPLKFVSHVRLV